MTAGRNIADVVVIGGGVIGLACAWTLARRGAQVVLVERGEPAREATWAAGGMLSPLGESAHSPPLFAAAVASLDRWPAFAAALEAASGVDVEYRPIGKLHVAFTSTESTKLAELHGRGAGFGVDLLSGAEARSLEPALSSSVRDALLVGRDHRVDNRRLGKALTEAVRRAGVALRTGAAAESIRTAGDPPSVEGVALDNGTVISTRQVVVAAGAWSGEIRNLPRPLPLVPVRGQMFAVETGPRPLLRHVIDAPGCYLIPRESGRIVVGATAERVGFARGPTPAGLTPLLHAAVRAVPAIAELPLVETWAGFRPGTRDDLPILGPEPRVRGLFYATGHYRNGVLLAPITAEIVAALVARDEPPVAIDAFRPERFSGTE